MTYYLERPDGARHGKADYLIESCDAVELVGTVAPDWSDHTAIICVIDNGAFEAAAYADTPQELAALSQESDYRPKRWLIIDKLRVQQMIGGA